MASFAGIGGFFGRSVRLRTVDNPTAEQLNHFFGLHGSEALSGGFEGRVSLASGILWATTLNVHNLAVESFRSFNDGLYYPMLDTRGVTWLNVRLYTFEPEERAPFLDSAGYHTPYRATLRHLS